MKENHHQTTQIIGSVVAATNQQRLDELQTALGTQGKALVDALEQIQTVREFVGSPEHILGNPSTKHGEIAEQVEVGIRNARDLINQRPPIATFEGISRIDPADYSIDGVQVQSKFINGVTNGLDHVLEHMDKYENFGRDGSYYHIPKDQYEVIQKVLNGESVDGLAPRTVRAIQDRVHEIEQTTGKSFNTVIQPGVSSYDEVQQGEIHKTLDHHENDIRNRDTEQQKVIELDHQASLNEMAQVALKGAAIGAILKVTFKLVEKVTKEKKNPFKGDFTADDWQDIGVSAAQGGSTGAVSGSAIYALTNFANLSAPLAGAVVSAGYSVASLAQRYTTGEIGFDEFLSLGQIACAESAMVAAGAALGQALIPIPIMGAIIGTIASRMVVGYGKKYLTGKAKELEKWLEGDYQRWMARIDHTYRTLVAEILAKVGKLSDLMDAAFDTSKNMALRLEASIDLARAFEVPEEQIIHDLDELDAFILA
ncbi:hypothetical protein [Phormidium sp. FACHB-1136]|uniref:hypothetical protein n=1 Tax=Phormidium sp. FACHB-1136 TaxID=2692848 RepID=UPI001687F528|nr:hypothetical protein [Phormidium sp. FACHB-1136]MBD2426031.1 hypothetical protein [Phormidium sp. FACHB-1136]